MHIYIYTGMQYTVVLYDPSVTVITTVRLVVLAPVYTYCTYIFDLALYSTSSTTLILLIYSTIMIDI